MSRLRSRIPPPLLLIFLCRHPNRFTATDAEEEEENQEQEEVEKASGRKKRRGKREPPSALNPLTEGRMETGRERGRKGGREAAPQVIISHAAYGDMIDDPPSPGLGNHVTASRANQCDTGAVCLHVLLPLLLLLLLLPHSLSLRVYL